MRMVSDAGLAGILAGLPGPDPRIVASGNFATPTSTLRILDESVETYRLFMLNAQLGVADRDGVTPETPFVGPAMRGNPRLRYIPSRLSLVPALFSRTMPPDAVIVHTSAPHGGTVSLGTEVNILPAAITACRARGGLVIAQMNPRMPYTYGDGQLSLDDVDIAVEVDEPLATPSARAAGGDDIAREIGDRVASLVRDGATMQLGIGAVPDAVLAVLVRRRGLKIWSEMFSDGLLDLHRAGALDEDVPVTASFCFGSQELYEFVHRNPRIRIKRTEKTNDPALIAKIDDLISVNTALQVDLFAQANASRIKGRIYSGFGGQTDFIVGALHSPGGRAIIALPSWHAKAGVSTVVPLIEGPVTSFQHSHIISEQGSAKIWGVDARDQARQLISNVAHPKARDELTEAGEAMGLL